MKLYKFISDKPILLEGEGGMMSNSFQVGMQVGVGEITEIDDLGHAVLVRRKPTQGQPVRDLIIKGNGIGLVLEASSAEPRQLAEARRK